MIPILWRLLLQVSCSLLGLLFAGLQLWNGHWLAAAVAMMLWGIGGALLGPTSDEREALNEWIKQQS